MSCGVSGVFHVKWAHWLSWWRRSSVIGNRLWCFPHGDIGEGPATLEWWALECSAAADLCNCFSLVISLMNEANCSLKNKTSNEPAEAVRESGLEFGFLLFSISKVSACFSKGFPPYVHKMGRGVHRWCLIFQRRVLPRLPRWMAVMLISEKMLVSALSTCAPCSASAKRWCGYFWCCLLHYFIVLTLLALKCHVSHSSP